MALKDLLDQVAQHPKTVAVALFACLVVGGFGAVFYLKVSEARIALLDERMRMQEDASKRQKHVNRLVQEQVGSLRKGFEGLPPAVVDIRTALAEPEALRQMPTRVRAKVDARLQSVETQLVVLQSAITNSEALSKSLEALVTGAIAEEEKRYADAARLYRLAANSGVIDAQARLARLYLSGNGVEKNLDVGTRLLEASALLGDLSAKDDAVKLYLSGHGDHAPSVRAAALLSIEPRSSVQATTLVSISRNLSDEQRTALREQIELLRKQQITLVEGGPAARAIPN